MMNDMMQVKLDQSALIRDFISHPGFAIWKAELDRRLDQAKNSWMTADAAEGERIKVRAQVYTEMLDVLKKKIVEGDLIRKTLQENQGPEAA